MEQETTEETSAQVQDAEVEPQVEPRPEKLRKYAHTFDMVSSGPHSCDGTCLC